MRPAETVKVDLDVLAVLDLRNLLSNSCRRGLGLCRWEDPECRQVDKGVRGLRLNVYGVLLVLELRGVECVPKASRVSRMISDTMRL